MTTKILNQPLINLYKKALAIFQNIRYNNKRFKDGFPSGQRGQTVNLLATPSKVRILLHPLANMACADVAQLAEQLICNQQVIGSSPIIGFIMKMIELNIIAGWSSLEARRAHNPKVVGSNPAPAILPR